MRHRRGTVIAENAGTGVRPNRRRMLGRLATFASCLSAPTASVTAPGFSRVTVTPFALEINQTTKINASLKVGAHHRRGAYCYANLNTKRRVVGTLFTNEIANIPLNGGNFSVTLFQGAIATDPQMTGSNAIERSISITDRIYQRQRNQANNYTLDEPTRTSRKQPHCL